MTRPATTPAQIGEMTSTEYARFVARRMTETELDTLIQQAARAHGWLTDHFRPARTSQGWNTPVKGDPGGPDRRLVHPDGYVILAELKTEAGRLSAHQRRWNEALETANANRTGYRPAMTPVFRYFLWRPSDWIDGSIAAELARHP